EVDKIKPDVVIIATGVKPFTPEIPGLKLANVVSAEDVLLGKAKVGDKVIVVGGELVGCETALFLADKGKKVTVTRRGQYMAAKMHSGPRALLLSRLAEKGVRMFTGVTYIQASDSGLTFATREGQDMASIEADTIVLATGSTPNTDLLAALDGKAPEIYCIGDCIQPRGISEAISEAYDIARKL
ncbi:FAD-dependent oxidoreductase, partial [Chloroflexota bacterium]